MSTKTGAEFLGPPGRDAGREQRRAEAVQTLREVVQDWRDAHGLPIFDAQVEELVAHRLFDLQPAYCPYDCSGCHDDECPCPNCVPEADQ